MHDANSTKRADKFLQLLLLPCNKLQQQQINPTAGAIKLFTTIKTHRLPCKPYEVLLIGPALQDSAREHDDAF